MTKISQAALSLLVLLTFISTTYDYTWAAEKSAKLSPVRIGYVSRSILDMPYIIARDRGFFREEGLEPELIFMRAAQTIPAMLAGGVDFGTATGTAIAAAVSGVDVRLIFALTDRPSFDLISLPSITSVQQLRGKKLGTSGVGSLAEILARQILIANKIPLEQVTFLPFGTSDVTYVALKAGTIDATMLQIPQKFFAVDEGFRNLAAGADVYRAVMGGLTTTKNTINDRPELVNKTIRATMRAVNLIKNDKNYVLGFMKGPHLDLSGERARFTDRVYDATIQLYLSTHTVDETLQREMIAIASQRVKPGQPVPPERVFDFSFVQKATATLR
ncbi:MAG TPA: ABC transporter substrate-binding protein [Candidatus Binatia bacterium]|nr:ABC transporter substrate-binding protein [Candidatus Binatia bacterium]